MFIKFAMVQRSRKHLHVAMVKFIQIRTSAFVLSHFRFSDTYELSMNTIGGH